MLHEFKDDTSQDTGHDMNYFKIIVQNISSSTVMQAENKEKFADLGLKHFTNVIKSFPMFFPCRMLSAFLNLIYLRRINKVFFSLFSFLLLR